MKKTINKKFVVALAGFLSFGTLSGVAVATNNKISDAEAATTVLVKRAEVSPNGTQLVNGSLNWAAGTNLSISSTTYAGKSCAEFSRSASTSRLAYTGPEYTYYWHKCVLTYSLSTSFTGSYMFTFGSLKQQKLSTGNFQTSVFDYTVDSSKDPDLYKKELNDGTYFGFNCSDTSVKLYVYSFEFFEQISQGTVSIASGAGISSAFVSSDPNATSGSTSQKFDIGTNVYGFVTTQAGYSMGSGWTLVSGTAGQAGARWRNAGHNVAEASYSFGTVNASLFPYTISWDLGGGSATGLPSSYTKDAGFSTSVQPTKRGYTFLGWTGSNGSTPQKTISVAAGQMGNKSYTANWQLNEYTITYHDASGVSNPVSYTVKTEPFTLFEPSKTGAVFTGWTGSQLSEETKNLTLNPQDPGFVLENKEFTANFEYDPLVKDVIDKIKLIGGPSNVTYYGSLDALNTAQSAYDNLISSHPEYEGIIEEYDELVEDWNVYNGLKENAIGDAETKIDAIGTVSYPSSKASIDAARTAFDALAPVDQADLTTKENTLEVAETEYASLRDSAISNVIDLIDAIGEVSLEKADDIGLARSSYESLASEDKPSVTNYATLVAAEARLAELQQAKADAEAVDALIETIGQVSYPTSKAAIDQARGAYEALTTDEQRGFVEKLAVLEAAETTYASLRSDAINNVKNLIVAISQVTYPDSKDDIIAARSAYDAMADIDKASVTNYGDLTTAESTYETLRSGAINNVINLIDAIGEVSLEKEDEIVAARAAYDALAEEDKSSVTNYATLVAAEARLAELKAAKADAEAVDALIDAIGEVTYPGSKTKIDAARAAYNTLTNDDQRGFVEKLPVLEAAKAAYETLRSNAINNVIDVIDAIGEVSLEKEDEIVAARAAYDALAEEDRASVTNYLVLVAAEARLAELKAAKADAESVDALINAIGEVTYPGSKTKIDAARAAYNALTNDDQRGFVEKLPVLEAAEAAYEALRVYEIEHVEALINDIGEVSYPNSKEAIEAAQAAYDALDEADKAQVSNENVFVEAKTTYNEEKQAGVNAVQELIENIGKVEYSNECKTKIDAAQTAFDALTDEQKALVNNFTTLSRDATTYAHVEDVVQKINKIGEVDLNSAESIKAAKEAYESLSEEEKALIPGYHNILVEKEQTYTEIEKSHNNGIIYAIVFGTIGGILVLLALAYVLLMFVFNRWIKKNRQAYRVIKLWKNKEGKRVLIATPCKVIHRYDEEVFKTKDEALK